MSKRAMHYGMTSSLCKAELHLDDHARRNRVHGGTHFIAGVSSSSLARPRPRILARSWAIFVVDQAGRRGAHLESEDRLTTLVVWRTDETARGASRGVRSYGRRQWAWSPQRRWVPPDCWVETGEVLEADTCRARPIVEAAGPSLRRWWRRRRAPVHDGPTRRQRSIEGSWGTLVTMSMISVGQTWSQDVIEAASVRVATSHLLRCVRTFSYLEVVPGLIATELTGSNDVVNGSAVNTLHGAPKDRVASDALLRAAAVIESAEVTGRWS